MNKKGKMYFVLGLEIFKVGVVYCIYNFKIKKY